MRFTNALVDDWPLRRRRHRQDADPEQEPGLGPEQGAGPEPGTSAPPRAPRLAGGNGVLLAGLVLVMGQLGWTAIVLTHSYFRQDDFVLLNPALHTRLSWGYLMTPYNGHLMPAGLAIIWALARISLYNWLLASVVIMVLVAAASLALLRALLTLCGPRPGILIPLALYLFAPLGTGTAGWLSAAVKILPLELALFMAVGAHLRYLRGPRKGSWRHLAAAAIWLVAGMASADQGAVVPLLLFAITVSLVHGRPGPEGTPLRWTSAASRALAEHRRAWLLYGTVLALYGVTFFARLSSSGTATPGPGETIRLYRFAGTLIGTSVVPGALGGPWRWAASGYAQAAPPAAGQYVSWGIAVIVIAVSLARWRTAWSAWAIWLGWIVLADILPVAVKGFGGFSTATLGADTGYVADATAVLALCVALVFLPPTAQGEPRAAGVGAPGSSRLVRAAAIVACGTYVAGTAVSLPAFVTATPGAAARSYIATARAAISAAPHDALVIDGPVPATVLSTGFFGAAADTSRVIEPLAADRGLPWTSVPAGVIARPMMFDDLGRLAPLAVAGPSWVRPAPGFTCLLGTSARKTIRLDGSLYQWPWTLRLSLTGSAGVLVIRLGPGGTPARVSVPAGPNDVYIPVTGQGNALSVQLDGGAVGPVCITGVRIGLPQPDSTKQAIPAAAIAG